jgi:hypothetical protein
MMGQLGVLSNIAAALSQSSTPSVSKAERTAAIWVRMKQLP